MVDEFLIELHASLEAMKIYSGSRSEPILYDLNFGRIYTNSSLINHKTQTLDTSMVEE
jgi:hypothetical protein